MNFTGQNWREKPPVQTPDPSHTQIAGKLNYDGGNGDGEERLYYLDFYQVGAGGPTGYFDMDVRVK